MSQIQVINAMRDISRKRHNNQLTEAEAEDELRQLIGDSDPDSLRWKVFEESRLMKTPVSKLAQVHRKRLKDIAVKIDPDYFGNASWGDGV